MPAKKSQSSKANKKNKARPSLPPQVDLEELEKKGDALVEWMQKNPSEVIKSRQALQERIIKKRCIYGETPLPTTLMPLFLKQESFELFAKASEILDKILNKTIDLYFQDPVVREYFPYSEIPKEWIEADPGYRRPTLINRHDALFDGKELKFIEFNTDNPGGKGWVDTYEEIFHAEPMYKDLIDDFGQPVQRKILQGFYDTVLSSFKEMSFSEKPRVALVDFREISMRTENEIVRDYFIEKGIEANLVDARDFELKKGKLWSGGVSFNIILRTLKAEFYRRFPREMKDFIQGVTKPSVCMINSFRSVLGSEKAVLSFLTNPFHHHYFEEDEVEAIKKHIPWTRKLDETITISPEGEEINLKSFLKANRERLVLKPSWGAGGSGVMVGDSAERADWEDCVDRNIGCPWWTVQEKVPIPRIKFPVIKNNQIITEEKFVNFSPFVFGGKYVGMLGRTSGKDVINVSAQGGVIPVFRVKEGKKK